ncbi:universal stress protein [Nesterenkonia sandarakina]|uniref:Nucleotide-binding universal stress UspA family protein n=1 Tax=Nesterenkonia sandarakina TaxID=272918 RepID=A0A2T0YR35_9MICC|nr:universal stress protein [Nesterenkonia sandarakina]PRZ18030.1 nucleotide-binding universal stress UspA family protein [Nesterenkonia sandarakina]
MAEAHEATSSGVPGVLVGIDGSAGSERAFKVGLMIAKQRELPLRLIGTFIRPVVTDDYYVRQLDQYRSEAAHSVQDMLDEYSGRAAEAGVVVTSRTAEGDAGATLVDESSEARIAVVGKRGRNRFAGRFLGSVSGKLAAHAHCPTLVVPERWESDSESELMAPEQDRPDAEAAHDEPVSLMEESSAREHSRRSFANVTDELNFDSEIVVGVDVGDRASDVVHLAAEAADLVNAPLTLVSAAPLNAQGHWYPNTVEHNLELPNLRRRYTDHLEAMTQEVAAKSTGVPVRWQFFDGSPAGVLSEASRTATLVVLGTRGHGGFAGLLLGSVSQAVLNRAVCPVLVIPTHEPRRSHKR